MTARYLLATVIGTVLVFAWGGAMWAGGAYDRFLHPLPGGDAVARAIDAGATTSGMYVHPAPPPAADARSATSDRTSLEQAHADAMRRGPLIMLALTKGGQDPDDPRMLVRGFLIELFATAMLVAAVGLAGSAHGRLRRFLSLLAMVTFMALSTHMVSWAFMNAPNEWTAVTVFDSVIGWTLAGLPAVFLLRARGPADTLPA